MLVGMQTACITSEHGAYTLRSHSRVYVPAWHGGEYSHAGESLDCGHSIAVCCVYVIVCLYVCVCLFFCVCVCGTGTSTGHLQL